MAVNTVMGFIKMEKKLFTVGKFLCFFEVIQDKSMKYPPFMISTILVGHVPFCFGLNALKELLKLSFSPCKSIPRD